MDYLLAYDARRGIAAASPSGAFDLGDALTMTEALVRDERFQPRMNLLFDGSLLDLSFGTGYAMRELADTLSRLAPEIGYPRVAIVGASDLAFGLGRMIEASTDIHLAVGIFRNRDDALAWLASPLANGGASALHPAD